MILILGRLFLLGKATYEIQKNLEGEEGHSSARGKATFDLEKKLKHDYGQYERHHEHDEPISIGHDLTSLTMVLFEVPRRTRGDGHPRVLLLYSSPPYS